MSEEKPTAGNYFANQRDKFIEVAQQTSLLSHLIGSRQADARRVWTSSLFMRACVTARSVERLLTPQPSGFGEISYLDHASIASLTRGLIENVAVLLYLSETEVPDLESQCRKYLIDLHDYKSRREFLALLGRPEPASVSPDATKCELQSRLRNNAYFSSLPAKIQKRLLTADDMYINGRMNALRNIGWSDDHTKAIYKYLSMQAHTMPMSFHRTEANKMYADESEYARVVAGFAVEHARQALGAACLRILALFPDIEGKFSAAALRALKDDYGPQLRNTE